MQEYILKFVPWLSFCFCTFSLGESTHWCLPTCVFSTNPVPPLAHTGTPWLRMALPLLSQLLFLTSFFLRVPTAWYLSIYSMWFCITSNQLWNTFSSEIQFTFHPLDLSLALSPPPSHLNYCHSPTRPLPPGGSFSSPHQFPLHTSTRAILKKHCYSCITWLLKTFHSPKFIKKFYLPSYLECLNWFFDLLRKLLGKCRVSMEKGKINVHIFNSNCFSIRNDKG